MMGKYLERLEVWERNTAEELLDSGKSLSGIWREINKMPKAKKTRMSWILRKYLKAEALDLLSQKTKRKNRSENASKNIVVAMELKAKEPKFYKKVVEVNSQVETTQKLFEKPFSKTLPNNSYPYIGVASKNRYKFWGVNFFIITYSAQVVDNEMRPDCNGIAIVHTTSGEVLLDCIMRKRSQTGGVNRDKAVMKQARELVKMSNEDFQKFLFKHPLALEKYLWPTKET